MSPEPTPTPAPSPEPPAPGTPAPEPEAEPSDLEGLRKALASERQARKRAEAEVRKAGQGAGAETVTELQRRLLGSEIRAAAAGRLQDPADAERLLELGALVDDDGAPDAAAIDAALDELVKAKPYLAPRAPSRPAPQGTRPEAVANPDALGTWLRSR